jgi:hypothetical protein
VILSASVDGLLRLAGGACKIGQRISAHSCAWARGKYHKNHLAKRTESGIINKPMLRKLFFGCSHQFSWPLKLPDGTYQVCVRCGAKYGYDWQQMRRMKAIAVIPEPRLGQVQDKRPA